MAENSTENIQKDGEEEMEVLTMVDVLKEEQEFEEGVKAVLGGSDGENCTYLKGYVKRQALYACTTCTPHNNEKDENDFSSLAGICLACSYKCHEGHTLIELYTKRNFRCDCGNKKFGNNKCTFVDSKDDYNENNLYNQNFYGLYCICKRPYPDPEDTVKDEMIQCAICEDWYHFRHLEKPSDFIMPDCYDEMICQLCMNKYEFLKHYSNFTCGSNKTLSDESMKIDVEAVEDTNCVNENSESTSESCEAQNVAEGNKSNSSVASNNGEDFTENNDECKMPESVMTATHAVFICEIWRKKLCTCSKCQDMYKQYGVSFITDSEETVKAYEEKGKSSKICTQYEAGMEALSSLDRVKQIEAISEYNEMKTRLKEYLQKFVDNKKIVREDDIKEFFSSLTARKRQRVEVPKFCR